MRPKTKRVMRAGAPKVRPADGAHFFETADGAHIWYEIRGTSFGTPVVFLDGLGCAGFIWRYLWDAVTPTRTALHPQYRGHGNSHVSKDDTRIGLEFILEDVRALLAYVGLKKVVLVGHSMGVQVALEYQRRFPNEVAGLILICGSYEKPLDTWHDTSLLKRAFPYLRRAVERAPKLAHLVSHRVFDNEIATAFGMNFELNPLLIKKSDFVPYLKHLATMDPRYFVRTLASVVDHSAWEYLPSVRSPVLVVTGERDRFTPAWLSQKMAAALPDARLLVVEGGTHTAPLERHELVDAAVVDFLRDRIDTAL